MTRSTIKLTIYYAYIVACIKLSKIKYWTQIYKRNHWQCKIKRMNEHEFLQIEGFWKKVVWKYF